MRLLNTETLQLEYFLDESVMRYAILSHRWEDEEVTFQDMMAGNTSKRGFQKIKQCCAAAAEDGIRYAWVDTCCIDKTSSAELTEAINSMYRWYEKSYVCYAFLFDVRDDWSQFEKSEWFTRGWTLQELLAPKTVVFYGADWNRLGHKTETYLIEAIHRATGIDYAALKGEDLMQFSISKRMSWAARRKCTRIEDRAYSLIGIFDVNMPMLYGEGEKAFVRLQEEIIKHSSDHSIFAWTGVSPEGGGLLARSPDNFVDLASRLRPLQISDKGYSFREGLSTKPYLITNRGLSIELNLTPWAQQVYVALLSLTTESDNIQERCIGIFFEKLAEDDQFRRVRYGGKDMYCSSEIRHDSKGSVLWDRKLYLRKVTANIRQNSRFAPYRHFIPSSGESKYAFRLAEISGFEKPDDFKATDDGLYQVLTNSSWDPDTQILEMAAGNIGRVGIIESTQEYWSKGVFQALLGFDFDCNPVCVLQYSSGGQNVHVNENDVATKTIANISCLEPHGWLQPAPRDVLTRQPTQPRYMWALKGDRNNGLEVTINDHTQPTRSVRMSLSKMGDRTLWVVSIKRVVRHEVQQPRPWDTANIAQRRTNSLPNSSMTQSHSTAGNSLGAGLAEAAFLEQEFEVSFGIK